MSPGGCSSPPVCAQLYLFTLYLHDFKFQCTGVCVCAIYYLLPWRTEDMEMKTLSPPGFTAFIRQRIAWGFNHVHHLCLVRKAAANNCQLHRETIAAHSFHSFSLGDTHTQWRMKKQGRTVFSYRWEKDLNKNLTIQIFDLRPREKQIQWIIICMCSCNYIPPTHEYVPEAKCLKKHMNLKSRPNGQHR